MIAKRGSSGAGRDRVAALSLISVLGGQTDVHVLARAVSRPVGDIQHDASDAVRLVDELGHVAERPVQSPQYRCSRHGSPYM